MRHHSRKRIGVTERRRIERLYRKGISLLEISQQVGRAKATVSRVAKNADLHRRRKRISADERTIPAVVKVPTPLLDKFRVSIFRNDVEIWGASLTRDQVFGLILDTPHA